MGGLRAKCISGLRFSMQVRPFRRLTQAVLVALLGAAAPPPLEAQVRPTPGDTAAARRALEQQLGRGVSHAEILERLRQSGMTRAQARARLQQSGLDPSIVDAYYDAMERGGDLPGGRATPGTMEALERIGATTREDLTAPADTSEADRLAAARREVLVDSLARAETGVFGLRTFRVTSSQFQPITTGPVGPSYRIGPGDELLLILSGDIEAAYSLDVTREGFIFIPDVGQMQVSGLSMAELRDVLYSRLGRVYSGVTRSPNASTRFQVTIGQLRTNQVFVTGDVLMPGSYIVSSVSGVFNALYQAGGPTESGSFRNVEVHRGGTIIPVDLYSFLIGGSGEADVRLETNDRIFVPPAGIQVRVEGAVRRSATYEMKAGEDLTDVIRFAGGFRSDALVRRVQIDRILPPNMRAEGRYRSLIDVDLTSFERPSAARLEDGDVVHVFGVTDERRNRIWIGGGVRNPGVYEYQAGMTLWSLLSRADGLLESAYTPRAHILRFVETDGTRRLIRATLERDEAGRPLHDLVLADNDSIVVLTRTELANPEFVSISGFVKEPDTYTLAAGMTLKDLILAAGGFTHGAYVLEAEITRMPDPLQRSNVTAHSFRVPLTSSTELNGGDRLPSWVPNSEEFELAHGDRVFIRRAPGYEAVREVTLTGEVMIPGTYVLVTRDERLADVVRRAGGLTAQADPAGMHVKRDGRTLAAEFEQALQRQGHRSNIALVGGDTVHVPAHDPTVVVSGAVNFESRVVYVPGKSVDYYINQAGGYLDAADRKRATISYANGERSAVRRGGLAGRGPDVRPGSEIYVPAKPESRIGTNWDMIMTRSLTALTGLATLLLAVQQLR
jgi:polysaccharide biosynthesis/export protein